jgi:hypothetical protein
MNTQYRQYEVNYLPWTPFDWDYIGSELRLGKVVFRPLSDDALQGIDERVADYLRLYFSRFRDLYNNPVNTITLCHYDPKHRGLLEPMSDAQQAEFAGIIDALTFCCIWGELREALNRGWRLLSLRPTPKRWNPVRIASVPMCWQTRRWSLWSRTVCGTLSRWIRSSSKCRCLRTIGAKSSPIWNF